MNVQKIKIQSCLLQAFTNSNEWKKEITKIKISLDIDITKMHKERSLKNHEQVMHKEIKLNDH